MRGDGAAGLKKQFPVSIERGAEAVQFRYPVAATLQASPAVLSVLPPPVLAGRCEGEVRDRASPALVSTSRPSPELPTPPLTHSHLRPPSQPSLLPQGTSAPSPRCHARTSAQRSAPTVPAPTGVCAPTALGRSGETGRTPDAACRRALVVLYGALAVAPSPRRCKLCRCELS